MNLVTWAHTRVNLRDHPAAFLCELVINLVEVETVIVSDQHELTIFLIRFPPARVVVHEEVLDTDAFDVTMDRSKGFNWSK